MEVQGVDAPISAPEATLTRIHAGWHPDPFGRFESRYWDGTAWTKHVSIQGRQHVDAPQAGGAEVQQPTMVPSAGVNTVPGEASILSEPILVVSQKPKRRGANVGYKVRDQHGKRIGAVEEVDRDVVKRTFDRRTDNIREYRLHVVDRNGRVLLAVTKPPSGWRLIGQNDPGKWNEMFVDAPDGTRIGRIVLDHIGVREAYRAATDPHSSDWKSRATAVVASLDTMALARFRLEVDGHQVGAVIADDRKEWDFRIEDDSGDEVARITKSWAGWVKERFTRADNYVVDVPAAVEEPLRSLAIATALSIDLMLKQGTQTRGSSLWGTRTYK
jgi:hypothetical protein